MLPDAAFEPNEESCRIVKRKDQQDTMADNHEDSSTSLEENPENDSGLYPALVTGILVSFGIGLFTVCAMVFWICKKQLAQVKGKTIEDKCILVRHGDKDDEAESVRCSAGKIQNQENLGQLEKDEVDPNGKIGESESHEHEKEDILSTDTEDNSNTVNDCCCPVNSESTLEKEQSESIKAGATLEMTCDTELTEIKQLATCENNMMNSVDSQICSQHKNTSNENTAFVQLGPNFNGYLSITCTASESHRNPESTICSKPNGSQNKVVLQQNMSEYKPSVSITCNSETENSTCESVIKEERATMQQASHSLQYLAKINEPHERTDGSLQSKDSDSFIFPLEDVTETQVGPSPQEMQTKLKKKLSHLKNTEVSKSLDSQIMSLKKGCQLLETKPFKSSLKSSGSDGCLQKKYVHFPEDIRNIRKVHKYENDDGIWLNIDTENNEDETAME